MKPLLFTCLAALLSTCATAETPLASITLGPGNYRVEPPGSSIAGYKSVEFSARLTNTSKQPVWYYSQFPTMPSYRQFVRASAEAQWKDRTQPMCGVGAGFHPLAPSASVAFGVWTPASDVGGQFRVEISIYSSPDFKSSTQPASSPATPIQWNGKAPPSR